MKKIASLLLVAVLMLVFVGCNNNTPTNNDKPFAKELLTSDKIVIGTSPDYPPFESLDASGNLVGFEIELLEAVVAILNEQQGTNYTIEWKQMDFETIIGALQTKQVDLGVSSFTWAADRDCIFTTPHLLSKQVVITRNDTGITQISDLVGKKIGAGGGTTGEQEAKKIENATVLNIGDYSMMFQALQAGQLDAVVCDEAVGDNYVKTMGLVKLEETLLDESVSVIIHNDSPELAKVFNAAVEAYMATDAYSALLAKWDLATVTE